MLNKIKSHITYRPLLQTSSDLIGNGDRHCSGGDGQGDGGAVPTHGHRHGLLLLRLEQLRPVNGASVNHFGGKSLQDLKIKIKCIISNIRL